MRNYVLERQERFPGVSVAAGVPAPYPHKELAAQIFGTVGEISPDELKQSRVPGRQAGHHRRQGRPRVHLRPLPAGQGGRHAHPGRRLRAPEGTSPSACRPGQAAQAVARPRPAARRPAGHVRGGRDPDHRWREEPGGAFVAMDPRNGEVLAMGSYPSFDPNIFAKPLKQSTFNKLNSEENGPPLFNRAVNGLLSHRLDVQADHRAGGARVRDDHARHGDRRPGLHPDRRPSSSTTRATRPTARSPCATRCRSPPTSTSTRLGAQTNGDRRQHPAEVGAPPGPRPAHRHRPARRVAGHVPTALARRAGATKRCTRKNAPAADLRRALVGGRQRQPRGRPGRPASHAAPARHRLLDARQRRQGRPRRTSACASRTRAAGCCRRSSPPPARRVKIDPAYRQAILDGLQAAASQPGGTSADVFAAASGRIPCSARRAPPQRGTRRTSPGTWRYVPDQTRPIVIAVTVEQGGFGAEAAAPAARLILSEWFGVKKKLVTGKSTTLMKRTPITEPDPAAARGRPRRAAPPLPLRPAAAARRARAWSPAR